MRKRVKEALAIHTGRPSQPTRPLVRTTITVEVARANTARMTISQSSKSVQVTNIKMEATTIKARKTTITIEARITDRLMVTLSTHSHRVKSHSSKRKKLSSRWKYLKSTKH